VYVPEALEAATEVEVGSDEFLVSELAEAELGALLLVLFFCLGAGEGPS
jgi:hypothetical protein